MKLLYAPDCSDHPNWGCRYMGDWYRNALAAVPGVNLRRIGSRWFFQQDARIPAPANFGELQRIAETAHRNDALANVAAKGVYGDNVQVFDTEAGSEWKPSNRPV